jgi:hypothetical protein
MLGGGVETASGRDQFPGHLHAEEHLAPGFAVVAGGLQNVGDTLGSLAVLQEVEDGLAIGRTQGSSTQAISRSRSRRMKSSKLLDLIRKVLSGSLLCPGEGHWGWTIVEGCEAQVRGGWV